MNPELLKLLKEQKKDADRPIGRDKIRDEWVAAVRALVDQVAVWLKPATEAKLLTLRALERDHSEDRLGRYTVPTLEIMTPNGTPVLLEPYARMIVGGKGRVDMHSGSRSTMLVRGDKGGWFFALRSPKGIKQEPLSEETFSEAFRAMLGS